MTIERAPVRADPAGIVAAISPEPRAPFEDQRPARVEGRSEHMSEWRPSYEELLARVAQVEQHLHSDDVAALAAANEKLRGSEAQHRLLIENSHDILYLLDTEGRFTFVSPAWTTLLGHPVTEVVGHPFQQFVHPDDVAGCRAFMHTAYATGQRQEGVEYRVRHRDGSWRWHTTSAVPVRNAAGAITGGEGIARDITERKRSEAALRASEERFRLVTQSLSDVVYEWDLKDRVDWYGDVDGLMGYPSGGFPRTLAGWGAAVHPEDQPRVLAAIQAQLAGAAAYALEYRVRKGDGGWRWWQARGAVVRDEHGQVSRWVGAITDVTDRKRADEALRASEERYWALFERSLDLIYVHDLEGNFVDANDTTLDRLGYTRAEIGSLNFASLLSADQLPLAFKTLQELRATGTQQTLTEFRLRHRAGHEVWVETRGALLLANGAPVAVQSIARDITARRQAEAALRESEERFRSLVDNTGEGIGIVDLEDRFVYANGSADAIFGMAASGLVGHSLSEFVAPEVFARFGQLTHQRRRGESSTYQLDLRRPDGSTRTLMVTTTTRFDAQGRPQGSYGVFRDVTESRRMEAALRASEARFRAVFDHATDGIILTDVTTGRFAMANRAMGEMLGYAEDELVGRSFADVHPEAALPLIAEATTAMGRGQPAPTHDLPLRRKDGSVFFAEVRGALVRVEDRPFMLGVFRDVTEKRRLEASLAQADRLASMGMLAAGVAHEINNPLAYLLSNVESLAQDLPQLAAAALRCGAALRESRGPAAGAALAGEGAAALQPDRLQDAVDCAREALEGAHRIKAITRGLGTFARVERVERGPVDLNAAIEHAATMAHNEIKYRARLEKDLGPVPAVWASEGKVAQVFLNLLVNAAQAIGEGDVEHNVIGIRTWAEGHEVLAEVTDTGKGIPPENLDRVFEPFFSTKMVSAGSGLGLAICRNIVTGFGGDIRVESQVGQGTRFVLRLPVPLKAATAPPGAAAAPPAAPPDQADPAPPARPAGRGRLLVVDDEAAIRRSMQRLLGRAHEVVTAVSGAEARAILERDPAFDLVLCDLMMPEMSGMELHAWLAESHPELAARVVFVTGGAFTPRASEYVARVGNLRIEKPFDAARLARLVADLVAAAHGQPPAARGD